MTSMRHAPRENASCCNIAAAEREIGFSKGGEGGRQVGKWGLHGWEMFGKLGSACIQFLLLITK